MKKDSSILKTVVSWLSAVFFVVILCYTGYRTYNLLTFTAPGSIIVPLMGLTLFDVGMLAWGAIFLYASEGIAQRGIALLAALFDLFLVCAAVILDMALDGQALIDVPEWAGVAAFGVLSVAAVVNVVCAFAYKLTATSALTAIREQAAKDRYEAAIVAEEEAVTELAFGELQNLRQQHAQVLASQIGERMFNGLTDRLGTGLKKLGSLQPSQYTMPAALMTRSNDVGGGGKPAETTAFGKDIEAPKAPPPPNSQ